MAQETEGRGRKSWRSVRTVVKRPSRHATASALANSAAMTARRTSSPHRSINIPDGSAYGTQGVQNEGDSKVGRRCGGREGPEELEGDWG